MAEQHLMTRFIPDKQLLEEELAAPTIIVERPPAFTLPKGLRLVAEEEDDI